MKTGRFLRRRKKGAMAAEYVATLYLLFMFLAFPLLNLATTGLRSFFLWFAANQAVATAVKCRTFQTPVTIGGVLYPPAYTVAQSRAAQIRGAFPGIDWPGGGSMPYSPPGFEVDIIETQIPNSTASAPAPAAKTVGPAVLLVYPDPEVYVSTLRVIIRGWVVPLIPVPWFNVAGLSGPMGLNVESEAEFENPPGLLK
jgi:hypothetical protein